MKNNPIYFAAFYRDDDKHVYYFRTLSSALDKLASEKDGTIILFYLRDDGTITEDDSEWWSWNGNKPIKNKILSSSK